MTVSWGVRARTALVAVFLVAALEPGAPGSSIHAAATDMRPNVVMIVTDDQRADEMWAMPLTQRMLTSKGVSYSNAFVSYPLCCPSRATIFTGKLAHNHGVRGNAQPEGGYERFDGSQSLPVWLQAAGYRTIHVGKFLNRYGTVDPLEVPPGWDEWNGSVGASTYSMWGYTLNENGTLHTYGTSGSEDPALYQTDLYRRRAVDAIRRNAASGSPFFLSLAFLAPHAESVTRAPPRPAPRHAHAFAGERLPRPPSFNEPDVDDKPVHMQRRDAFGGARRAEIAHAYRSRLASLLAVDEAVRAIVRALRQAGVLGRTLIVFTSDNGYFLGEHRLPYGKYLPYDAATRVPLVMRYGPFLDGVVDDHLVSNVDIVPTILEVTGAAPEALMDGISLAGRSVDPSLAVGRPVLVEGLDEILSVDLDGAEDDGSPPVVGPENLNQVIPRYAAIRTQRFLYVEWETGERELYDYLTDPFELTSAHLDPRYALTMATLARDLDRLRDCAGADCVFDVEPVPAPLGI